MAEFHYQGFTAVGDLATGDIEASSLEKAEEALRARGLTPLDIRLTKTAGAQAGWSRRLSSGAPHLAELADFIREFATLEEAGIPVDRALRILEQQSRSKAIRPLALGVLENVLEGSSLSQAMAARPQIFTAEYLNITRAGEITGDIGRALTDLADLLERRVELRARMRSALVYPSLLIVLAAVSTGIVLTSLVPAVAPMFSESGREMPAGLAFIVALGNAWQWIVALLIGIFVAMAAMARWIGGSPEAQKSFGLLKFRVPLAGPMIAQYEAARFARALGTMLRSGVRMMAALEASCGVIGNAFLRASLDSASEAVRGRDSLASALSAIPVLPPVLSQVVAIGEESGKLDTMLLRVALMFERQTERRVEQAMSLLTPVLTILIAAIVGGLILSVMNAVLGINDLATQ